MTRPARVVLVRHAPTAATRRHAFPADEPLDERGLALAASLRDGAAVGRAVSSPAARCRQTAAAFLPDDVGVEISDSWAELDFGAWAGRTMSEVEEHDGPALRRWLDDPEVAPPGGETLTALARRVASGLDDLREPDVTTVVVTSAGPIKVAVLHALGASPDRLWHLDVSPCSVTTLHSRPCGGWTVRAVNTTVPTAVRA